MNLKSLREDKLQISVEEMAVLIGKTEAYVLAMEANPEMIDLKTLKLLAEKANMSLDEIEAWGALTVQTEQKTVLDKFGSFVKEVNIVDMPKGMSTKIKEIGLVEKFNNQAKEITANDKGVNFIEKIKEVTLANNVAETVQKIAESSKVKLFKQEDRKISFAELWDKLPKIPINISSFDKGSKDEKVKNATINIMKGNIESNIEQYREKTKQEFQDIYENTINIDVLVGHIFRCGITRKSSKNEIQLMLHELECYFKNSIREILKDKAKDLGNDIQIFMLKYSNIRYGNLELGDKKWISEQGFLKDGISCTIEDYSDFEKYFRYAVFLGRLFDPSGGIVAALVGTGLDWYYTDEKFRNKIAEKIVEAYEKDNLLNLYMAKIDVFWNENSKSFNKLVKDMDKAYKEYAKTIK